MKKILYTNIILFILILVSEVFNLIFTQDGIVYKHYFILVNYRLSYDVFAVVFDFTYLLILIGITLNIRYLLKYKYTK